MVTVIIKDDNEVVVASSEIVNSTPASSVCTETSNPSPSPKCVYMLGRESST